MTEQVFRFHRFGGSFVGHGTPDNVRRYLDYINQKLTSNFWSAQPVPRLAAHHGINLAAELAKPNREDSQ